MLMESLRGPPGRTRDVTTRLWRKSVVSPIDFQGGKRDNAAFSELSGVQSGGTEVSCDITLGRERSQDICGWCGGQQAAGSHAPDQHAHIL